MTLSIFFSPIDRINVRRVFEKDFREQRFTTNLSFAFSSVSLKFFFNPFISFFFLKFSSTTKKILSLLSFFLSLQDIPFPSGDKTKRKG